MDVFEAMFERRSVRKYEDSPVAEDDLRRILEAGRWAPSWTNTQPWEVVIVRDPETRARLTETLSAKNPARKAVTNAPVVIAVGGRKGKSGFYKGEPSTVLGDWLMFDVALFLNNVALAAHALGYGTVHVGLFDQPAVAKILEVPDDVQVVELMPLGRPASPGRNPGRREIAEFLHSERFGR